MAARDVEFNVTANDKTGTALASAERKFKESQRRIEGENKKHSARMAKVLESSLGKGVQNVGQAIGDVFENAGKIIVPLLGYGVAAASPVIAATLSAAIAAGVSIGVAGIGVALVSQDARVKAAGTQLGKSLFSSLQQDAAPFIGPVLHAIDTIQSKFNELRPTIQRIFANASKFVAPLVGGITHAIEAVIGGVDKLVAKSGGIVEETSRSIGKIGDSVGNFLANINTKDAKGAIQGLTATITGLINILGPLLGILTKVYALANRFGLTGLGSLNTNLSKTGTIAGRVAGQTDELGVAFQGITNDTYDYAAGLEQAKRAVDDVFNANRSLYSSTTQVAQAFADASKAAKENGHTLSLNSEKGRANRAVLSSLAGELNSNYQAFVKVNGEGGKANTLAAALRARFVTLAEKMGASKTAANRLADGLLGIPNVNRKVDVKTAQANAAAEALKTKLAGIQDRTVYITAAFNQGRINKVQAQLDRIGNFPYSASTFSQTDTSSGSSRTGGASPVNVQSTVNNVITLDGAPFRQYTARQIEQSTNRNAWRTRVGTK